jgi:hypothetical protein
MALPLQIHSDRLPLVDRQADLVIYHGSLYYATDYRFALRDDRWLVGIDTPI